MKGILSYIVLPISFSLITASTVFSQESVKSEMICKLGSNSLSQRILTDNLKDVKLSFNDLKEEYDNLNICITYLVNNEDKFDVRTLPSGFVSYINEKIKNKENIKNALYINYLLNRIQLIDQLLLKSMGLPDENYLSPVQKAVIKIKVKEMSEKQLNRVATNEKRLQRYGTQGECHGKYWSPFPVDNQYQLDKLRYDMGLGSIADYKKMFHCERFYN